MMAKIADQVEKMAQGVTEGYKKMETGVVEGFNKVTDKCVEKLFAKEGESVEEAKSASRAITDLKGEWIMNKNDQEFLVQKIRTQYTEKQHTELDMLKALDTKVKRPANLFAYIYGSISAIIMGTGMSLVMTELGDLLGSFLLTIGVGLALGIVGIFLICLAYLIYNRTLRKGREKIAPEVLQLTEELLK